MNLLSCTDPAPQQQIAAPQHLPRPAGVPQRQRGATLIEVLVTFVILAVGIMGLAGMQVRSLSFSQSALYRTTATALADDMLDRMRANRTAATTNLYNTALANPASSFTNATQPQRDLGEWKAQIEAQLPSGQGAIAISGSVVTISVKWDDTRGDGNVTFTTNSRL